MAYILEPPQKKNVAGGRYILEPPQKKEEAKAPPPPHPEAVGESPVSMQDVSRWREQELLDQSLENRQAGGLATSFVGGLGDTLLNLSGFLSKGDVGFAEEAARATPEQAQEMMGRSGEDIAGTSPLTSSSTLKEALTSVTGGEFSPRNPLEEIMQSAASGAGEAVALGGVGGSLPLSLVGTGAAAKGAGSAVEQMGGSEGAKALTEAAAWLAHPAYELTKLVGKGGANLLSSAIDYGKEFFGSKPIVGGEEIAARVGEIPKFFEEVGTPQALADLELSSKDLSKRVSKFNESNIGKIEEMGDIAYQSISEDIPSFNHEELSNDIVTGSKKQLLNSVSPVDATPEVVGQRTGDAINNNFTAAKQTYSSMYNTVEELTGGYEPVVKATTEAASDLLKKTEGSVISTSGDKTLRGYAERILDAFIPKGELHKKAMMEALNNSASEAEYAALVDSFSSLAKTPANKVTLKQLFATKRAINNILKKADILPAPVDMLKPIAKAIKEDIIKTLDSINPRASEMFKKAEELFQESRNVFDHKAVTDVWKGINPEQIESVVMRPTNLKNLKSATTGYPQVQAEIDRMVLDNISSMPTSNGRKLFRELKPHLGDDAVRAGEKILNLGDSMTSPGIVQEMRKTILEDLFNASETGERPEKVLKMMKTDKGRKIVSDSLSKSSQGQRLLDSVKKMSRDDVLSSIVKEDGSMNFENLNKLLKSKEGKSLVSDLFGKKSVPYFQTLETYGKNMEENVRLLASKNSGFFKRIFGNLKGKVAKGLATTLGFYSGGPVGGAASYMALEGINLASEKINTASLYRVLTSDEGRKIISTLGKRGVSYDEFVKGVKGLTGLIDKETD